MKKTAWDFGSSWESGHQAKRLDESAETTCNSKYDYLGFRLVHGDASLPSFGGSWIDSANCARAPYCFQDMPSVRSVYFGFRVVYDREET